MTLLDSSAANTPPQQRTASPWQPRTELVLVAQQLRAIEQFNRARHDREQAAASRSRTRELRLDATRSLQVLRREHDAVVARAHAQLRASGDVLHGTADRRVVLAHRSEWFLREVAGGLRDGGVCVVAQVDNGADAVGLLVAEQPDLVLVEDALAMARGDDVVREAREFAPDTLVGVHVGSDDRLRPLREAGAAAVFPRLTRPRDVAAGVLALLAC